jgi:hypothetical protein
VTWLASYNLGRRDISLLLILEPVPKFKLGLVKPFDKLRTNGLVPFMVSLSNHEALEYLDFGIAS